jgi:hypothetical protein
MRFTKYGVSSKCNREAPSWEAMAQNHVEASWGEVEALVRKPREIKEEETGTDSHGVCALKLLEWLWIRIAFKGEIHKFFIGGVKQLA